MTNETRNENEIVIRPMIINIDAYATAQADFINGVVIIFITSFFSIASLIALIYRFDNIKSTLGL
jgi:hypothetical protein